MHCNSCHNWPYKLYAYCYQNLPPVYFLIWYGCVHLIGREPVGFPGGLWWLAMKPINLAHDILQKISNVRYPGVILNIISRISSFILVWLCAPDGERGSGAPKRAMMALAMKAINLAHDILQNISPMSDILVWFKISSPGYPLLSWCGCVHLMGREAVGLPRGLWWLRQPKASQEIWSTQYLFGYLASSDAMANTLQLSV